MELVVDQLKKELKLPLTGKALWAKPANQSMQIDYTTPMGGCSNLYYSLIFQMPKWGYRMASVNIIYLAYIILILATFSNITAIQRIRIAIKSGRK